MGQSARPGLSEIVFRIARHYAMAVVIIHVHVG
jgi:hypothetical protein